MKGLVGRIMGYFYESRFCFGLARRASQIQKNEINIPRQYSLKRPIRDLLFSSRGMWAPLHNENALHTNVTPLQVQFLLYATLLLITLLIGWK